MSDVLVSATDLYTRLSSAREKDPVLLDVRWTLAEPDGRRAYSAGHLPGAVYVDLEHELAGPGSPEAGRHPLPTLADLQAAARSWGVDDGADVVVYDDAGGTAAARAWWLLRWGGHPSVRILDGGLAAWARVGGILEDGDVRPHVGDVELAGGGMPTIDADGAAAWAGILLDSRAGERFRGESEPIDPRAGHIPGAVSAPTSDNLDPAGRFLGAEALRARFAALGIDGDVPVAAYCGSGVTASHEIAALAAAGIPAALYPGSWSQWSNDPDRPAATGA
ncbi:Rhodanese domain protein [Beutenbergia cavernae DSM 12333]|uniref:Rhodanese domain protein n=1 Tax=Beutenbergia cavernae (strain ATCC BAA-8 / DSM 12333 / CCUG 43141 / JCM 11478 / NBRC 16432 / NCIMB 13614 / HKI 0122) TaxID=471853 RepID=C5BZY3_BEUC1|nr:sulfurtransferase [Beutenbergia cavernae]ACQ81313.1 Rhodanese domain protein [Beutenbergia cavernae DSM 12333]